MILFKKELYMGTDRDQFRHILAVLDEAGISATHKVQSASRPADVARGAGVGRYGETVPAKDIYYIYVAAKDFETAKDALR